MMRTTTQTLCLFVMVSGILIGCGSKTPVLDHHWGQSYEAARFSQTLNPEPDNVTIPVEGMSGIRSVVTEEKYNESFGKAQERPIYYINMPGVTSNR